MAEQPDPWAGIRSQLSTVYRIPLADINRDAANIALQAQSVPRPSIQAIYATTPNQTADLIAPIEDFDPTSITVDSRLSPSLVEKNLDEALALLEAALAIRREYAEATHRFLEARLRLEEFFRLDAIHRLEVEAGVYELPWRESEDHLRALNAAVIRLEAAQTSLDALFTSGALTQAAVDAHIGSIAELSALSAKDSEREAARTHSRASSQYRSGLEKEQWSRTQQLNRNDLARSLAQRDIEARKAAYLRKDVTFRQNRAAVARDLAYARLAHHSQMGGALNYEERLGVLRLLFRRYFTRLLSRLTAIRQGAAALYGIILPAIELPPRRSLDSLAL